jgi:hypothetical protein
MRVTRLRFSLRRLMLVVTALGLNFGIVPWPGCAVIGAAITLPLFVTEGTLIDWTVIYSIAGVLAGLSMPAVSSNCRRRGFATPPAARPAVGVPVVAPTCSGPVGNEMAEP